MNGISRVNVFLIFFSDFLAVPLLPADAQSPHMPRNKLTDLDVVFVTAPGVLYGLGHLQPPEHKDELEEEEDGEEGDRLGGGQHLLLTYQGQHEVGGQGESHNLQFKSKATLFSRELTCL